MAESKSKETVRPKSQALGQEASCGPEVRRGRKTKSQREKETDRGRTHGHASPSKIRVLAEGQGHRVPHQTEMHHRLSKQAQAQAQHCSWGAATWGLQVFQELPIRSSVDPRVPTNARLYFSICTSQRARLVLLFEY